MASRTRSRWDGSLIVLALLLALGCRSPRATETSLPPRAAGEPNVSVEEAWMRFCESLIASGEQVDSITEGEHEIDRLEGYRLLTRMLGLGFDRAIEHATGNPVAFFELQGPKRKYAGDNPDQRYHSIPIDGRQTYRIRGRRGNALLIEIGVYGGDTNFSNRRTDGSGSRRLVAYIDEESISFAADGSFEVVLGPDATSSGDLRIDADASNVLVRTYHEDPRDKQVELEIERVDATEPSAPLTATRLAEGLLQSAAFVETTVRVWGGWTNAVARDATNVLVPMPDHGDILTPAGVGYHQGYWSLDSDEAMTIVFDAVDVPYWGFVIMNRWMESMEWRDRTVSLNNHQLEVGADGRIRIIIAHRDPGMPNWIDTAGHRHGLMSTRFARLQGDLPEATVEVVPFDSLRRTVEATVGEAESIGLDVEAEFAKR